MNRSLRLLRVPVALALAVGLAATACLGRSPDTKFYTLEAVPGPTVAVRPDLAIGVGPISLPRYLDQPGIVVRKGPTELAATPFARWAGGLEANVLRALAADLVARLGTQRVVRAPLEPPFPIDYRVLVDFDELVANADGGAVLRARWSIRAGDASGILAVEVTDLVRPPDGDSVNAQVDALADAIGSLADAIAGRIAALDAARPPTPTAAATPVRPARE